MWLTLKKSWRNALVNCQWLIVDSSWPNSKPNLKIRIISMLRALAFLRFRGIKILRVISNPCSIQKLFATGVVYLKPSIEFGNYLKMFRLTRCWLRVEVIESSEEWFGIIDTATRIGVRTRPITNHRSCQNHLSQVKLHTLSNGYHRHWSFSETFESNRWWKFVNWDFWKQTWKVMVNTDFPLEGIHLINCDDHHSWWIKWGPYNKR